MNKTLLASLGSFAVMLAVGCTSSSTSTPPPAPAQVRVVHASPDAPAVDVTGNGAALASNAPYKAATAFVSVPSGTTRIKVNAAGTATTVIDASPNLMPGRAYTVIAANQLSAIEPLVVEDDAAMPTAGNVKVRVVHAAPKVASVDVYVTAPGAALASATPTLAAVPFKGISGALQVPAATYQVRLTAAGAKTAVFDSGSVPLAAGSDLVLIAIQQDGLGSPVSLLGLTAAPATPKFELLDALQGYLRVMHASPNAPAVDVLVDGTVALAAVPYPVNSGYLPIASGSRNIKVNAAGTANTVINANLPITSGQYQSVYAVNFLSAIEPLVVADNLSAPAAGKAKLRVIHGSPDAGPVDVLVNNAVALPNVAFKAAAAYLEVAAGTYNVKINVAGSSTTKFNVDITLAAGRIYTAKAIGSTAGGATNAFTVKLITDN